MRIVKYRTNIEHTRNFIKNVATSNETKIKRCRQSPNYLSYEHSHENAIRSVGSLNGKKRNNP